MLHGEALSIGEILLGGCQVIANTYLVKELLANGKMCLLVTWLPMFSQAHSGPGETLIDVSILEGHWPPWGMRDGPSTCMAEVPCIACNSLCAPRPDCPCGSVAFMAWWATPFMGWKDVEWDEVGKILFFHRLCYTLVAYHKVSMQLPKVFVTNTLLATRVAIYKERQWALVWPSVHNNVHPLHSQSSEEGGSKFLVAVHIYDEQLVMGKQYSLSE